MHEFYTDLLGFAAFLDCKASDRENDDHIELVRKSGKRFTFESSRPMSEWMLIYTKSDEAKFNASIMRLRQL